MAPKCGFFFPPKIHSAISNGDCKAHLAYALKSLKRFNVTNRYDKAYNQNIENEPEYLNTSRTHLLVKAITITLPSSRHLVLSSVLPGRFFKTFALFIQNYSNKLPYVVVIFQYTWSIYWHHFGFCNSTTKKAGFMKWKSMNTCLGDQIVFLRGRGVQTTAQLWTSTMPVFYSTIKLSGLSVEAQIYTENDHSFTFALSIIFKHNLQLFEHGMWSRMGYHRGQNSTFEFCLYI